MDKDQMNIQWYPGHMTKTRRMIVDQLKHVDAVCEILDARIPVSSRNPDVDELTAGKPRLVVLNRVDQADPEATKEWAAWFRAKGYAVLLTGKVQRKIKLVFLIAQHHDLNTSLAELHRIFNRIGKPGPDILLHNKPVHHDLDGML